jgi:ASC-1-like (ASCH) protein
MTKTKGGPKTEEGKAISKYNAVRHGLLSKEVLVDGEDKKVLSSLEMSLYETLSPAGTLEELLVDRVVANVWRLRRAIAVERNTMEYLKEDSYPMVDFGGNTEKKSLKDMLDNESIENILRYETTIERSMYKALHELERLQAKRNGKDTPIPAVVDVTFDSSFSKKDL